MDGLLTRDGIPSGFEILRGWLRGVDVLGFCQRSEYVGWKGEGRELTTIERLLGWPIGRGRPRGALPPSRVGGKDEMTLLYKDVPFCEYYS